VEGISGSYGLSECSEDEQLSRMSISRQARKE
jgi:hypothetical protein